MVTIIEDIIEQKISTAEILKREFGTIIELLDDGYKAKVAVNNNELTFINKSNEELSVGDEVEIRYWTNIGNGYIAAKNGTPTPMGIAAHTKTAVVVYDGETDYNYIQDLYDVELSNNKRIDYKLGAWNVDSMVWDAKITYNNVYINGYAATYVPPVILKKISDQESYSNYIMGIDNNLFYKQVVLPYYDTVSSALSKDCVRYITYYVGLYDATYDNSEWKYRYALYVSDPNRTTMHDGVVEESPVFEPFIISDNYTDSDNVSLEDVNFALLYRGNFTQYHYNIKESKTQYVDKLSVLLDLVLIIKDKTYFRTRHIAENASPCITAHSIDPEEIDCIKAKVKITEQNVL